jgi:hypothetical protein
VISEGKRSTASVVRRICEMVRILRHKPVTRADLARRWKVSRRQVSHIVSRADVWFGVRLEHRYREGYYLRDSGILDVKKIGGAE